MTERQRAKRDGRCRIDMQRAKHNGDGCVICRSTITSTPDWTAPAALVLVLALPCARPTACPSAAPPPINRESYRAESKFQNRYDLDRR